MNASTKTRVDAAVVGAADLARQALLEGLSASEARDVGDHLGHRVEGERVVTHYFQCRREGYRGWRWAVTVARASRQKTVTVDEAVLVPGDEAIVAPEWVPYKERLRAGDLSPGDLLPVEDDDPRLVPTYSYGQDPSVPLSDDDKAQIRQVAQELGLGRVRTLSPDGRAMAAERWYDGEHGPNAPIAQSAPATCTSCGFLVRLAGSLSELFGVCANAQANDDGRVVSFDHGCGAHSEVKFGKKQQPIPLPEHVFDTLTSDEIEKF